jgi:hypothetical protein
MVLVDTTPGTTAYGCLLGATDAREVAFLVEEFDRRFAGEEVSRAVIDAQKAENLGPESVAAIRTACERYGVVPFLLLAREESLPAVRSA